MAVKTPAPKKPVVPKKPAPYKFSGGFYKDVLNRLNAERQSLLSLNAQGADNELDYLRGLRDTDEAFGKQKLNNLNRSAARGTAYSSQYAKAATDTSGYYNKIFGDLSAKRKQFLSNDLNQRSLIKTSYNDFLKGLAMEQADDKIVGKVVAPVMPDSILKQNFKTPDTNSFLQELRAKYGI